ncbi:hypothetical protein ACWD25_34080, partial [Streptomyces sp. NPDC002920]
VAGSTGALALTGLPGGERATPVTTLPAVIASPTVSQPQGKATLATGTDGGLEWRVTVDVWPAPADEAEARAELNAMAEYGESPAVNAPADLIGRSAYFVHRGTGENGVDREHLTMQGLSAGSDAMAGTDIEAAAVPLDPDSAGPERLVIGRVAKTAQQVTCAWKDGTSTEVHRVPPNADINSDEMAIRPTEGLPYDFFVCLAPKDTAYESANVTG